MSWIDAGRHWLRTLFQRDGLTREMDDEMRFHLELEAMDQRAGGSPDAAADARRRFGHIESVREDRRRASGLALLDRLRQDATYARRQLVRAPGFTIAVALTLALGVGANATMFAIVDRIMLRAPEGLQDAEHLVQLRSWGARDGLPDTTSSYSYASYMEFRAMTDVFERVTAVRGPVDVSVNRGEEAVNLRGTLVGDAYFETLGVQPALGRFFRPDETREPEGAAVAVISERLWRSQYGGDASVLGRTLLAGGTTFTIVGVAPRGFSGYVLNRTDLWLPIAGAPGLRYGGNPNWYTGRGTRWLGVVARLRKDVPETSALARVSAGWTAWNMRPGAVAKGPTPFFTSLVPARASNRPEYRVARLLGFVALLLLAVTVANVANLLLARALARRREVAIRLALGVSRARLATLWMLDAILLALIGAVAAIALAWIGIPIVRSVLFAGMPMAEWGVDARVALVSVIAAAAAGLAAGIVPALQASRPALLDALRSGSREGSAYRSQTRRALLIAQGALTITLLAGTGLFVRSLERIGQQRLGLDLHRVVVADFDHGRSGYTQEDVWRLFYEFRDRARLLPGVESASLSVGVPLEGQYGLPIAIPGLDSLPGMPAGQAPFIYAITPDFFATMGTHLLAGRLMTDADDAATAAPVAIVNEKFARLAWNGDALGKCFKIVLRKPTPDCLRVVGIAEDLRENLTGEEVVPQYFVPVKQAPGMLSELTLLVRASDARALSGPLAALGRSLRPDMPYVNVRTLEEAVAPELRPWRLGAAVFALFGVLALIVAAVGTYSVVQFGVSQRQHEIGVRIALGARRRELVRMVLGEALRSGAAASAAGLAVVLAAGPLIQSHLFRTSPRDPQVLAVVVVVLLVSAALATALPAWRATRVDPLTALKTE